MDGQWRALFMEARVQQLESLKLLHRPANGRDVTKPFRVWILTKGLLFAVTLILLSLQWIPHFLDSREGTVEDAEAAQFRIKN